MTPSQAVQPTTNEAAERLRDTLGGARQQWLDAALSEERRLTVEIVRRHFGDKAADIVWDELEAAR